MTQPHITGTTHTLPFHQLSPRDFERLCLWLAQREGFERAEHLGACSAHAGHPLPRLSADIPIALATGARRCG